MADLLVRFAYAEQVPAIPHLQAWAAPASVAVGLGLLFGAWALGGRWSPQAQLWLAPPNAARAAETSRCPPRTLEEDSVCVPVPSARPEQSESTIALLPGRPVDASAYALPVSAPAQWVNLTSAEVPLLFRTTGPALLVNTPPNLALNAESFSVFAGATLIAFSSSGGWLLLMPTSNEGPKHLVLVAGMLDLSPTLKSGTPLPSGAQLARTSRALWLAARQLLPTSNPPWSSRDWQGNASVAQDLRNLLPLKAP